ncbi:hypothetical protein F4814DRAFT_450303 [Daldinia grandis]|nr:hypothetical protein F4814DRAFT_450303 [Daldinia grandis]
MLLSSVSSVTVSSLTGRPQLPSEDDPLSPLTERWPDHNPQNYYMDAHANAVPFPVPPEGQKAITPSAERRPAVVMKTVPLRDLEITPYKGYNPGLPRKCTYPNSGDHLTILQRRQIKLFVNALKQPITIVLPTKRNYYDSKLVISNLNQERVLSNLEKHPLAIIAEQDQESPSYEEDQSITIADEESYQESYEEFESSVDWGARIRGEPTSMADSDSTSDASSAKSSDGPFYITTYLASIEDAVQRKKTVRAGMHAMWPSNRVFNNVWRHPYYRGFEEDGDYKTWFRGKARDLGWDNDGLSYKPEDDGYWREVNVPQIGDEGIPDQAALDYVMYMRHSREKLEVAIRRKRELWMEKHGIYDSYAATFGDGDDGDDKGSSNDNGDGDGDIEEPPAPAHRPIRIKLVSKAKKEDAANDSGTKSIIPQGPLARGIPLVSSAGPYSTQVPGPLSTSGRPPKRGRGRGRGLGRGCKRKMDDDAAYEADSDESGERGGARGKRRRTV